MLKEDRKSAWIYIIPFLITSVMLLIIFYMSDIYPFGDRSLMIWDLRWQYIQFFSWFKKVLTEGGNIFYSFDTGMGSNMIGLFAYYLASPLNLLVLLFEDIQIFILVLTILKLALSSTAIAYFIKKRFPEIDNVWIVVLAVCYGMMSYGISQKCNIMWLDALVMLPLISTGVYTLVKEQKRIFLFASVLIMVISNWYMAYMCCFFSIFYFFFELLCLRENRKKFVLILQYGITMLLSVMSSMFIFLPTVINLLQGKGIESSTDYSPGFHVGIKTFLKGFLPGIWQGKAFGTESQGILLYCGTFALVCALLYFISKRSRKDKILSGILLLFLIVSVTFIPLENVWNGFRKANSYYCRFSFVLSFFILYLAAAFLEKSKGLFSKKIFKQFVCVWMIVELLFNSYSVVKQFAPLGAHEYKEYDKAQEELFDKLENSSEDFYRVEQASLDGGDRGKNYLGVFNEGLQYGYHSFATYTSTINSALTSLYNKCGYHDYYKFMQYNEPILLSDSLWGIRYIASDHNILGCKLDYDYDTQNGKNIYINPYALNIGYKVESADIENITAENPFEYQNKLISTMLGYDVQCYKKAVAEKSSQEDGVAFTVKIPNEEHVMYGYIEHIRKNADKVDICINGNPRTNYSRTTSYKIFQIEDREKESTSIVEAKGNISNKNEIEGVFYYLDLEELDKVTTELKKNMFQVENYKEGSMSGIYNATNDGEKLLLTIPYDKGWKIKCNGEVVKADSERTFIVLEMKKGENVIEMRYVSPGVQVGTAISILAILLFALWQKAERKSRNSKDVLV